MNEERKMKTQIAVEVRAVFYEDEGHAVSYPLNSEPADLGPPDAFGIYLRRDDGPLVNVMDLDDEDDAQTVAAEARGRMERPFADPVRVVFKAFRRCGGTLVR
jgi:hypothetical protein